jgi:transcriptional regulator with GAF, ATPase, and Fis domain
MPDDVISQAIVLTMLRYHIDADAAQTLVKQLATHQQQPLIDVARDLIAKFSVPTTADPAPADATAQPEPTVDRRSRRQDIDVRVAALIRDIQDRRPTEMASALDELTVTAVQYVPAAQYAGITVVDGRGRLDTQSSIGRYPSLLDVIEQRHQAGPCLQAVRHHHTVRVDDLDTDTRWPNYQRDALAQTPIHSVLSYRLAANHRTLGALNFYAERPNAFDNESETLGFVYATHAALAWNALRRDIQFRDALASRDIIGQAKGMLMERHQINAEAAFDLLRQLSQESNTPVAELSRRIAATVKDL